jgi:membrane fusion protein, adhesin transport system
MKSAIFGKLLILVAFVRALFAPTGRKGASTKRRFLGTVLFALIGFSTWAGVSEFDQVIGGEAKVVPSQQLQTIQHFEGGIVKEIHVKSGMDVELGQALISLDPLESGAEYQAKRSEFIQALIRVRRLSAEHRGIEPEFDAELKSVASSQIDNELLLAKARKARLEASLASFESQIRQKQSELEGAARTLALVKEERKVILTLVKKGLEPGLEAVRAEKTYAETAARVNEIRAAIDEVKDRRSVTTQEMNAEILDELAQASLELSKLEQAVNVAADKSDRSVIRSPVAGTVNRVFTTTVGGVIRPSDPIVEIVPKDSELLFEAKINPADIGYVRPGQKALLKLSTYDYSIYGVLEGYVDVVGSDSVEDQDGTTHYLVKLVPNGQITSTGKVLEMRSGMTAQIDIIAGKRSVLAYLSSPITKTLTSAFTEK